MDPWVSPANRFSCNFSWVLLYSKLRMLGKANPAVIKRNIQSDALAVWLKTTSWDKILSRTSGHSKLLSLFLTWSFQVHCLTCILFSLSLPTGNTAVSTQQCAHTASNRNNPWWYVDLGSSYEIDSVTITAGGECCGDLLTYFEIRVGDILESNGGLSNPSISGVPFGVRHPSIPIVINLGQDFPLAVPLFLETVSK